MKINVPEQITNIRKSLNLTQEQLAKRIGNFRCNIANYETGRVRTPVDVYLSILDLRDSEGESEKESTTYEA
jgi:transcriptional regulator with XRE-family HTH domain